ncbi:DUF378 domain-containing protein [Priestia koreensis]|uniref:GNAT family acetyltransferase n=1 Tax=Priestia koreensis TaxID=284581 RepID=A0A0M0KVZ6_9BACI|nr:DUF378 domain-containing protein [Priestia koreensis]KOO42812.1 GNAT family acetyltransferase [Priestia koreensis]
MTKFISMLASVLLIIGGLNWLFVSLDFNLVTKLFGSSPTLVDIIYWAIGLSAVYVLYDRFLKGK